MDENNTIKLEGEQKKIFNKIEELLEKESEETQEGWSKVKPFFKKFWSKISASSLVSEEAPLPPSDLIKIYEVSESLVEYLDLDIVLNKIVTLVHDHLGFNIVLLSLYNEETNLFERKAQKGLDEETFEDIKQQKIPKADFREKLKEENKISRSYFIPSELSDDFKDYSFTPDSPIPQDSEDHKQWRKGDMLIIPLYDKDDEIIGFFSVDHPEDYKRPSKRTILMLEIFAGQAVQAINNAIIHEEAKEQVRSSSTLYKISQEFVKIDDLNSMIKKVSKIVREEFDLLWVGIFFKDQDTNHLYVKEQAGLSKEKWKGIKIEVGEAGGMVGGSAATGRTRIANDYSSYANNIIVFDERAKSGLTVPIKVKRKVVGVLCVESTEINYFTQDKVRFFKTFANQIARAKENVDMVAKIEERANIFESVFELGTIVNSILNLDRLLRKALQILIDNFGYWRATILLKNEENNTLQVKANLGGEPRDLKDFEVEIGNEGITGIVAMSGEKLNIGDVNSFPLYVEVNERTQSEIAIPLQEKGETLGVLDLESPELNAFDDTDEEILQLFANQISIAIENALLYERQEELAVTDELTSLYNYRYFMNSIKHEMRRAKRFEHIFSLVMADLDDFKHYNDSYGHREGDKLLKNIGKVLKEETREDIDIAARYGGEEFVVIFPEMEREEAIKKAQQIRKIIESNKFNGDKIAFREPITISLGVTTFPEDAQTPENLIEKADQALYQAKDLGKNTVATYEQDSEKESQKA